MGAGLTAREVETQADHWYLGILASQEGLPETWRAERQDGL